MIKHKVTLLALLSIKADDIQRRAEGVFDLLDVSENTRVDYKYNYRKFKK